MAGSSSTPALEEAWIVLQFQLADLSAAFEGDIPAPVFDARDDAYGAIEAEYRGLPSMYRGEHDVDVEVPAYDICAREDELRAYEGRLVAAISFVSPHDFPDDAVAELKRLCIAKFSEAASAHGIGCALVGIEGWRRLSYVERAVIEG